MTLFSGNQTEVEGLCSAFTETITSLSEDCVILRQLASLQIATGVRVDASDGDGDANDNDNDDNVVNSNQEKETTTPAPAQDRLEYDENTNPNTMTPNLNGNGNGIPNAIHVSNQIQQNMIQQLNGLDHMLTQLENKVSTIHDVLKEEQQSMDVLEQTKRAAMGQAKVIQEIRQGMEDQELYELLPGNALLNMGFELDTLQLNVVQEENDTDHEENDHDTMQTSARTHTRTTRSGTAEQIQMNTKSQMRSQMQTPVVSTKKSKTRSSSARTNSNTPKLTSRSTPSASASSFTSTSTPKNTHTPSHHNKQPSISIRPVTETEFYGISKNIRGRITLSAINDALVDIQNVTRNKYNILSSRKTPRIPAPHTHGSTQYQQTLNHHRDLRSEDHGGMPFVSEQEMRDSCAFFRSGESTARAILLILRSAKRIKQVCGKKSQVTYVWLNE